MVIPLDLDARTRCGIVNGMWRLITSRMQNKMYKNSDGERETQIKDREMEIRGNDDDCCCCDGRIIAVKHEQAMQMPTDNAINMKV